MYTYIHIPIQYTDHQLDAIDSNNTNHRHDNVAAGYVILYVVVVWCSMV